MLVIMVFTRVGVVFSIFIFFIYVSPSKSQQCKACQARNFTLKSQMCICPENQYCNNSTSKCNKCDECYDAWNKVIKKDKGDVEIILSNYIKRYLEELKKLVKTLTDNIKRRENELKGLKTRSDQVGNKISKVEDDIKKLKKDVEEVENRLKNIGDVRSVKDLIDYLNEVLKAMKEIADKLKKLNLDSGDIEPLDASKLKNLNELIKNMTDNFPKLGNNSLNLALSLESDIDLLEPIILKLGNDINANKFGKDLEDNTKWIEKELLYLFSLLNGYLNVSLDVEALQKNATNARTSAQMVDDKLSDLLKKHQDFEKRLNDVKNETQFYKELKDLNTRLQNLNKKIRELEDLLQILRRKQALSDELDSFLRERKEFDDKEKSLRKYKSKLEKLYKEKTELLIKYNEIGRPSDEIKLDLAKMIQEANKIKREITEHCSSSIRKTT